MKTNIYKILDDDEDMDGEDVVEVEKLKSFVNPNHLESQTNFDLGEQEIILPIKKKKGRKSKKDKQLELEAIERNKVPLKLFPLLNEKIFDVIEIKGSEYFFDSDFRIIYDENINQVGIRRDEKYIIYADFGIDKIEEQMKFDDEIVKQIILDT